MAECKDRLGCSRLKLVPSPASSMGRLSMAAMGWKVYHIRGRSMEGVALSEATDRRPQPADPGCSYDPPRDAWAPGGRGWQMRPQRKTLSKEGEKSKVKRRTVISFE